MKVCTECTTAYAHVLDQCPNCTATGHVWDYQLPDGWHVADDTTRKSLIGQVAASQRPTSAKGKTPKNPAE